MRVAYVLRAFPVLSETFVLREIQELRRQGVDVVVCALARPDPDEPRHDGVAALEAATVYGDTGGLRAILRAPERVLRALPSAAGLCRAERGTAPLRLLAVAAALSAGMPVVDHVHAHFAHAPATVAVLLAVDRGVPCSFTAHARDLFVLTRPAALAEKVALARFVVVVTRHTQEIVRAAVAPEHRSRVELVRNTVAAPGPAPRSVDDPPLVLSVARLVEKKGGMTLVRACARLADRGIRFRCEMVGDGPLREPLERALTELGLGETVRLVGPLTEAGVRRAYARATVFALPCQVAPDGDRDAFPVALLEAMSHGVPVVTTAVSGIAELVHDGTTGLLVPQAAPDALADALERVLTDPQLGDRLAAHGRGVATRAEPGAAAARLRASFGLGDG